VRQDEFLKLKEDSHLQKFEPSQKGEDSTRTRSKNKFHLIIYKIIQDLLDKP
jgi:hypothetical protein